MHPLDIRSGLRKLEFQRSRSQVTDDENVRVLVEFVHGSRLEPHQTVCVSLGVRDGMLRQLVGRPTLLQEQSEEGNAVYYYRLQGAVGRKEPNA